MGSLYTHAICDLCWVLERGDRVPHRIRLEYVEEDTKCCVCGVPTTSGIYFRRHKDELPNCLGHDDA